MMKMKKVLIGLLLLFLVACSNSEQKSSVESAKMDQTMIEKKIEKKGEMETVEAKSAASTYSNERKVMYTANITAEVVSYDETIANLTKKAESRGGYIIQSNAVEQDGKIEAYVTFRIPQNELQRFIEEVKKASISVKSEQMTGEDQTEEYVDLNSRLKSKQAVEARLLKFMESAEKTEDLLKISEDLAAVQEEIEQLKGRIKYIENRTDYATVELQLTEIKSHENFSKDFNTWEKTKEQFLTSIHWIVQAASWIVVIVVGNLPIVLLALIIFFFVYRTFKKKQEKTE
ncbi:DUF4349 domain-containing protein [Aeribacillus pallidus]|nr:DUF4349 domain-containing protein [Aeribacillus pallidus]